MLYTILMFLMLCLSCETRIQDNRRIVITGKIQDQNGNPLEDINVINGDAFFKLGSSQSDENGAFLLTSLSIDNGDFDEEEGFVSHRIKEININAIENENNFGLIASNNEYNQIKLINDQAFTGVEIDLGIISLNKIGEYTINIDKGDYAGQDLTVVISANSLFCGFELQEVINSYELSCDNLNASTQVRNLPAGNDEESIENQALIGTSTHITIKDEEDEILFNQEYEINEAQEIINIIL